MLRPVQGVGGGFARMEALGGRLRLTVRASRLPAQVRSLRAMLYASAGEGAVLDLGVIPVDDAGCAAWLRDDLPPEAAAYQELLLTSDWPAPQLLLTGTLTDGRSCPRWQMEQALQQYLRVPPEDTAVPRSEETPVACDSVRSLAPLAWPEVLLPLKEYFDALPPCAPFDAPGWRFVRVQLEDDAPAPYCYVGRRRQGSRVTGALYALPGEPADTPPAGLEGYAWRRSRDGRGCWVLECVFG